MALPFCDRYWKLKITSLFCVWVRQFNIYNECKIVHFVNFLIDVLMLLQISTVGAISKKKHSSSCRLRVEFDSNTQTKLSRPIKHQWLYQSIKTFNCSKALGVVLFPSLKHLRNSFCSILLFISNTQPAITIIFDMYWEQKKQIINALNMLYNEKFSSVCTAALAFGITFCTLLQYSKASDSKDIRPPTRKSSTEEQKY